MIRCIADGFKSVRMVNGCRRMVAVQSKTGVLKLSLVIESLLELKSVSSSKMSSFSFISESQYCGFFLSKVPSKGQACLSRAACVFRKREQSVSNWSRWHHRLSV